MLSAWKLLGFLDPFKPVFGIIIDGNVPFIVSTGLIGGLLIKKIPVKEFKNCHCDIHWSGFSLSDSRIYSQEVVYNLKNSGHTKLGNDMQRDKLPGFHIAVLDNGCKKQNQVGILFTARRREFPYYLYCSRYTLLPHLELQVFRYSFINNRMNR